MKSFLKLLSRYLDQKSCPQALDWDNIQGLSTDQLALYENLYAPASVEKSLKKLAVLKLNGGLGSTMGIHGAKSALEVTKGITFLDMTIQQIRHVNLSYNVDVPLIFMTSSNTYDDTLRITKKYTNQPVRITLFNQSRYPQVTEGTYHPCPKSADDPRMWYPPGHGDLFTALNHSGVLDSLLSDGKEYLFVSNSDNLGATIDPKILQHMIDNNSEFVIEVTDKTTKDDIGGAIVNYEGTVRLVELDQVPPEHAEDFKSAKQFKSFNTNNLWIDLKAIKRAMSIGELELDIIEKIIPTDNDRRIQLETAAASAVKHFDRPKVINVPRERFLPVKTCSDLLLIKSDVYQVKNGHLVPNYNRTFQSTPAIKLSEQFRNIDDFQRRFKTVPNIADLDLLTVTGDVYFGRSVTLRGTIIIAASEGKRIDIPDGCVLENTLLTGSLDMIDL
ncbi:UTP--glucose-1-phosphate uridylyltransferase [Dendrothele bispora CBS 962.96]|uniref:UTP--glucose-1-phosphate uridylyltransferase n=1 Tax=Dendrothele bispora (strain CBS 962.96) TaxID=1314807 RepID=A0A4V4HHE2_DENBC|nr:UTP--glucose-1-phosphate uridylyltransferase [Dendrothele bispora CBS 962.96]